MNRSNQSINPNWSSGEDGVHCELAGDMACWVPSKTVGNDSQAHSVLDRRHFDLSIPVR